MQGRNILSVCAVALLILAIAMVGTATAKSLYMATQSGQVASYDISGNTLAWQAEGQSISWGDVGVAVDSDNEVLFITSEGFTKYNPDTGNYDAYMGILDPTNFAPLGGTFAPGASNLAGIVYDHEEELVHLGRRESWY